MAILNLTDKATYFPGVDVGMPALEGLIALAQTVCESVYGANRSLEAQRVSEILPVKNQQVFLSYAPVLTIESVAIRWNQTRWGRTIFTDWSPLPADGYLFDSPINRLSLFMREVSEVKVSYTTGFDFSSSASDVQQIKAIAGMVVDWAARRYYGQLDSYLINPSVEGAAAESWNFVRPDQYLQAMLLPLRKYVPRGSVA